MALESAGQMPLAPRAAALWYSFTPGADVDARGLAWGQAARGAVQP